MMWSAAVILVLVVALAVTLYGRVALRVVGERSSALPVSDSASALDREIAPLLADHPGEVGLRLLTDNVEAFALRAATARRAER